ncbi:MAG: ferredoxin family protein [Candidatus Saccharibacteria bacterium]
MRKFEVVTEDTNKAHFHLFPELCKGCGLCKEKCPKDCLVWSDKLGLFGTPTVIPKDKESCIACGICQITCPDCAILIEKKDKKKPS